MIKRKIQMGDENLEITENEIELILLALSCYAEAYETENDEQYEHLVRKLLFIVGDKENIQ